MRAALGALRGFGERVLETLLHLALLFLYIAVALPIGLAWRTLRPHSSWVPAKGTRWETPE